MNPSDEGRSELPGASQAQQDLRARAESSHRDSVDLPLQMVKDYPHEDTHKLLHELRVHQVELELQNEELRRVQVELEAARERYFDLYDMAPVGYCTVNQEGVILEANLTAASLFGLSRSALVKRSITRFMPGGQRQLYQQCCQHAHTTSMAQSCELQLMTQDGSHIWVSLSANVARPNTGGTTLRVMLKDITERVRLDEKLLEKNLELERTRQVADKANQAKSEFLASMSHELRSPLNAILGFAQLIAAGSPPPTAAQKSSIDHILHGGWYLLGLINEILDLAGIESGQLALSMGTESLTEVMRDCQSMIEPLARAAEIQVKFPSFDQACFVHADGRRLKQVLVNLLTNAIKYNRSKGEVTVSLSLRAQGRVRISIQDGGRGLTPEQLQQLFQPFNRLGQESGTQEGSGIGLVVCKRLVELMGGSIGAQSTPGVGSVFWFELAQSGQPGAAAVAMQALTEPTLVAPGVAPATPVAVIHTVLYVEDNAANVALVQQLVARRPDLQLISAQDALQGIAMVRLHQPRLILMDINLPGISGLQALYLLREDPTTRHIPVLAISANAMPKEIESALAAGFFAYLTKPIRVDQFMQVLDQGLALAAKTA